MKAGEFKDWPSLMRSASLLLLLHSTPLTCPVTECFCFSLSTPEQSPEKSNRNLSSSIGSRCGRSDSEVTLFQLYFSSGTQKRHGIHVMHLHNPPAVAWACRRVSAMIEPTTVATPTRLDGLTKNAACTFICSCGGSFAARCSPTSCRSHRQTDRQTALQPY